jgi:hypothetical protein
LNRARAHRALDAVLDARSTAVLLEEYRGFKIKRAARSESSGKGAVIVEGLSNRPRYFTYWSEDGAVQLAKQAIDKHLGNAKDMRTRPSERISNPCPYCDNDHDPSIQCRNVQGPQGLLNPRPKKPTKDAIQHIAVEPITGSLRTRVKYGENTAERAGFASPKKAQRWGESTMAKLEKQANAAPKFRSWKIAPQSNTAAPCPKCGQQMALVEGRIAAHTRPWLYGVQKNFKVDPANKKYQCKGSGQEPVTAIATDAPGDSTAYKGYLIIELRGGGFCIKKDGYTIQNHTGSVVSAKSIIDQLV